MSLYPLLHWLILLLSIAEEGITYGVAILSFASSTCNINVISQWLKGPGSRKRIKYINYSLLVNSSEILFLRQHDICENSLCSF